MKRIGVFCGSAAGKNQAIQQVTQELGRLMVQRDLSLVYGGASVGLMGMLADQVLQSGGQAYGVIPKAIERREIVHRGLTELYETETMHERKTTMANLSDAFLILPGGFGTLDEFFDVTTWAQLGSHQKPIGVLNIAGYYDGLFTFFRRGIEEQFIWPEHRKFIYLEEDPTKVLDQLEKHEPPKVDKWVPWDKI